jgi:hypothetical protein
MASPAEVANDLTAQAAFFAKRDHDIAQLCRDAARLIRAIIAEQDVDGRTARGVMVRLQNYNARPRPAVESQIDKSLYRGWMTLVDLKVGWQ